MEFVIYLGLALVGAAMGSFAGASLWRIRARQLVWDKRHGEPVDKKEYARLSGLAHTKVTKDRSRCLHCGYTLRWFDLLPAISWLSLRGKCRKCREPIGYFELLTELGLALFFVLSYALWPFVIESPLEITRFGLWLVSGVVLTILFAYDLKWFLLPDRLTALLAGVGVVAVVVATIQSGDVISTLLNAVASVGVLSGIYLFLYVVSKGKWIGFGDVKLGVGLGLMLLDWQLAFVALFLANFIGCLVVIPFMITGKLKRTSHVPFGPLLIVGAVIAYFIGAELLNSYLGILP